MTKFIEYKESLSYGTAIDEISRSMHELNQVALILFDAYKNGYTLDSKTYSRVEKAIKDNCEPRKNVRGYGLPL